MILWVGVEHELRSHFCVSLLQTPFFIWKDQTSRVHINTFDLKHSNESEWSQGKIPFISSQVEVNRVKWTWLDTSWFKSSQVDLIWVKWMEASRSTSTPRTSVNYIFWWAWGMILRQFWRSSIFRPKLPLTSLADGVEKKVAQNRPKTCFLRISGNFKTFWNFYFFSVWSTRAIHCAHVTWVSFAL